MDSLSISPSTCPARGVGRSIQRERFLGELNIKDNIIGNIGAYNDDIMCTVYIIQTI
jgi:hypothetical protein